MQEPVVVEPVLVLEEQEQLRSRLPLGVEGKRLILINPDPGALPIRGQASWPVEWWRHRGPSRWR